MSAPFSFLISLGALKHQGQPEECGLDQVVQLQEIAPQHLVQPGQVQHLGQPGQVRWTMWKQIINLIPPTNAFINTLPSVFNLNPLGSCSKKDILAP